MANNIKFSWVWHHDKKQLEWLQYIADAFINLADLWDEVDVNFFEETYSYFREHEPEINKIEMYEQISESVFDYILHGYICDSGDILHQIEHSKTNIIESFQNTVIFPSILKAVGIIKHVRNIAKFAEED